MFESSTCTSILPSPSVEMNQCHRKVTQETKTKDNTNMVPKKPVLSLRFLLSAIYLCKELKSSVGIKLFSIKWLILLTTFSVIFML